MTDDTRPTFTEAMFSLTGFDEIAIERSFKRDISKLKEQPFQGMRAVAFVEERRKGMKDSEAYEFVMGLSIKDVSARYADEDPGVDPGKAS